MLRTSRKGKDSNLFIWINTYPLYSWPVQSRTQSLVTKRALSSASVHLGLQMLSTYSSSEISLTHSIILCSHQNISFVLLQWLLTVLKYPLVWILHLEINHRATLMPLKLHSYFFLAIYSKTSWISLYFSNSEVLNSSNVSCFLYSEAYFQKYFKRA